LRGAPPGPWAASRGWNVPSQVGPVGAMWLVGPTPAILRANLEPRGHSVNPAPQGPDALVQNFKGVVGDKATNTRFNLFPSALQSLHK